MNKPMNVIPKYLMLARRLNQIVSKSGPCFAKVVEPAGDDVKVLRPGFRVVFLGGGTVYNPITNMMWKICEDTEVQKFHDQAEQFGMTAVDFAIKAAQ
jgi:hypothetical protein